MPDLAVSLVDIMAVVGTTCNVTIYPSFVHTRLSVSGPDDNALYTIAEGLSDLGATEK